jgi:hypothetical protein
LCLRQQVSEASFVAWRLVVRGGVDQAGGVYDDCDGAEVVDERGGGGPDREEGDGEAGRFVASGPGRRHDVEPAWTPDRVSGTYTLMLRVGGEAHRTLNQRHTTGPDLAIELLAALAVPLVLVAATEIAASLLRTARTTTRKLSTGA